MNQERLMNYSRDVGETRDVEMVKKLSVGGEGTPGTTHRFYYRYSEMALGDRRVLTEKIIS